MIITATSTFGLAAFAHALMRAESQKRSDSVHDELTGLPNRRGMEVRFEDLRVRSPWTPAGWAPWFAMYSTLRRRIGARRGS